MIYDNFALANGFRRHMSTRTFQGCHNVIRDVTSAASKGSSLDNSRKALQPLEPVDHLTGHIMVKCLDRIQALTDERDLIKTKLQSLADQIGVVAPGDDPLAALDVIGQRCRELSAKCHHKPTSATDPMTVPQQLGAAVEATKSRDDDDASHVVQTQHRGSYRTNRDEFGEFPCASPHPCTSQPRHVTPPLSATIVTLPPSDTPTPPSPLPEWVNSRLSSASFIFGSLPTSPSIHPSSHPTPPLSTTMPPVTLPPSDTTTPPSPLPEWVNSRLPSASFTFGTLPTSSSIHPSPQPGHHTPPTSTITHPVTLTPSGAMTPPQPTPEWFRSAPRPTFGGQRQNRGQTPSPVVGAATGASPAPPPPAIIVWDVAQLSPFDRAKGDMVLGKGAYGTVRLFRDKASRTPLAVKNFTLPSDPDQMVRRAQAIQDEANIQSILGLHPSFPTYHGCVEMAVGEVGIVMEFVGNGNTGETMPLGKVLYNGTPVLLPKDWFSVTSQLVQAVKFVHASGYLLNDLKEDNVLLSKSGSSWRAVVIDFGWVSRVTDPIFYGFSDNTKTKCSREKLYEHIAPECALMDEETSTVSDVFQLGRLIRLVGARSKDKNLFEMGENAAMQRQCFGYLYQK